MALERELETYERECSGWLAQGLAGQWVVIHHDQVVGFFADLEAAAAAGYECFGTSELFMIRQVAGEHKPIHSSRRAVHAHREPLP